MKNKILILGGNGFIGLHLQKRLKEDGFDVSTEGDVTNYADVESKIKDKDIIVNLASIIQPLGQFDPYLDLEVNLKGQINILEARKNINPNSKYIFIGSRMQFGKVDTKYLPVAEDYSQNPISMYGVHKFTAEKYCSIYNQAYNLESIVIRLSQVYGPSLNGKSTVSIIEKFIQIALRGETFKVNGYGEDTKDLIYIDDVVEAILSLIKSPIRNATYNVGSGIGLKLVEISKMIIGECGSGNLELVPFPDNLVKFELGSFYFDISKIKNDLGWEPKINIKEGIKRMVEWHKKNL